MIGELEAMSSELEAMSSEQYLQAVHCKPPCLAKIA